MYIFNPENDLALANSLHSYTPPASILKLGADLSMLPLWFAPNASVIVSSLAVDDEFVDEVNRNFNINMSAIRLKDAPLHIDRSITPWGWSPYLVYKLSNVGVSSDKLPCINYLSTLREYSSRKNAVKMLAELKAENSSFCGSSSFITDVDELISHLSSMDGDKALKMPLSGSGRGLIWILDGITDKQTDWARRVIKMQGGVVAEPKLNRVRDFAMEFSIANGIAVFEGYSLFESAASGAYMGNLLMSDIEIEKVLNEYISLDILYSLKASLINKLTNYFPEYNGVLGVDMMICNTKEGYKLQPCIEINMRMNMGLVSHSFFNRYVHPDSKGIYKVEYFKKSGDAFLFHKKMSATNPPIIEEGRIRSGYMSLSPVYEDTNYVAWVSIE